MRLDLLQSTPARAQVIEAHTTGLSFRNVAGLVTLWWPAFRFTRRRLGSSECNTRCDLFRCWGFEVAIRGRGDTR
jgi:hypothetical protein